jgi:hypothetical protein
MFWPLPEHLNTINDFMALLGWGVLGLIVLLTFCAIVGKISDNRKEWQTIKKYTIPDLKLNQKQMTAELGECFDRVSKCASSEFVSGQLSRMQDEIDKLKRRRKS